MASLIQISEEIASSPPLKKASIIDLQLRGLDVNEHLNYLSVVHISQHGFFSHKKMCF